MTSSLAKTTQQTGLQYSPSMSEGRGIDIYSSPSVGKVQSFGNDIDKLFGSATKAVEAYYALSDGASKQVAIDHLIEYRTKEAQISLDKNLTPEQKKEQLSSTLTSLIETTADKGDRFNDIYKKTFLDNARVSYAKSMSLFDAERFEIDNNIKINSMNAAMAAGAKWEDIYSLGKETLFKNNPELLYKTRTAFLNSKRELLDREKSEYSLLGKNWHIENIMTKDEDGVIRFDPDKAIGAFNRIGGGFFTLRKDGMDINDSSIDDNEKEMYKQEIYANITKTIEEASIIEKSSLSEARKGQGEFSQIDLLAINANSQTVSANIETFEKTDDDTLDTMLSTAESYSRKGDHSKAISLINKANEAKAINLAIYTIDSNVSNALKNPTSASMDILANDLWNGTQIHIVDKNIGTSVPVPISKEKVKERMVKLLDKEFNAVLDSIDGTPDSITSARGKMSNIKTIASGLGLNIDTIKNSINSFDSGTFSSNPKEALNQSQSIALASEFYDTDKSIHFKTIAGRFEDIYAKGKENKESDEDISKKMYSAFKAIKNEFNLKHNKTYTELSNALVDYGWLVADRKINAGTVQLFADSLASSGTMPTAERIQQEFDGSGKMITYGSSTGAAVRSMFEIFGVEKRVAVLSPEFVYKGKVNRLDSKTFTETLDKYCEDNTIDISNYDIDNFKDSNGYVGIKLVDKKDHRSVKYITGKELTNYYEKD